MDPLVATLGRIRRRLLAVRALEAGLAGAVLGGAGLLVAGLARLFLAAWVTEADVLRAALLPAAGFAAGVLGRWAFGVKPIEAARLADRQAGLHDQLATALEVLEARRPEEGLLDAALLDRAREKAAGLEVGRVRLSRSLGRRGAYVAGLAVATAVTLLLPPIGGPPLAREDADRARAALREAGRVEALAPEVRDRLEAALARLATPSPRREAVERATAEVLRAVEEAEGARKAARDVLGRLRHEALGSVASAAGAGDRSGAASAAANLAKRAQSRSDQGGLKPADREAVAADLDAAAEAARKAGKADVADALRAAAAAMRGGGAGLREALTDASGQLADLAATSPEAAVPVAAAVRAARRAAGLPAEPGPATAGGPLAAVGSGGAEPPDEAGSGTPGAEHSDGLTGPASPAVRPEDRDVVRRYFGG